MAMRSAARGVAALALVLAGCQTQPAKVLVYQDERFELNEAYSRLFDAPPDRTCEAARRALLSQGYLVGPVSRPRALQARKHFQPEGDVHVEIEFNVFCVPDGAVSTAYASAIQERYVLKRSANAASVGVNAIGSVSIPLGWFMADSSSGPSVRASRPDPAYGPISPLAMSYTHNWCGPAIAI